MKCSECKAELTAAEKHYYIDKCETCADLWLDKIVSDEFCEDDYD